jgi:hypothetical protein
MSYTTDIGGRRRPVRYLDVEAPAPKAYAKLAPAR